MRVSRMLLLLVFVSGCKVSTGIFIEKDWVVDDSLGKPDLRTKYELRMSRDFDSWDEVWLLPQGDNACPTNKPKN